MGMTREYRREFGDYAYYSGIIEGKLQLQFRTPNVAVLLDGFTGTLLKHGRPEAVRGWLKKYEGTPLFPDLVVAEFPRDYPVAEINRMLDTSGTANWHVNRASNGDYVPDPEYCG
jgi:hypothetical protein